MSDMFPISASIEAHQGWFNFVGHAAGIQQRSAMLRQMEQSGQDQLRAVGELQRLNQTVQRLNQTESQRLQLEQKRHKLEVARLEYEQAERNRAELRRQHAQEIKRCLAESVVAAEWLKPKTSGLAIGRQVELTESCVRCLAALQASAQTIEESLSCLEELQDLKLFYELRRVITECLADLQRASPDCSDPLQHVLQQLQEYEAFFTRVRDVRATIQGEIQRLADLSSPLSLPEIHRRKALAETILSTLQARLRATCGGASPNALPQAPKGDIHSEILNIAVCRNWQHTVPGDSSVRDSMLRFAAGEGPWAEDLSARCVNLSTQLSALEETWRQHRDGVVAAERLALQWHYRTAASHLRRMGVLSPDDPPAVSGRGFADIVYAHASDRVLAAFNTIKVLSDLKARARMAFTESAKREVESRLHDACLINAPRQSEFYMDVAKLHQEVRKTLAEVVDDAPVKKPWSVPRVVLSVCAAAGVLATLAWMIAQGSAVFLLVLATLGFIGLAIWAFFVGYRWRGM